MEINRIMDHLQIGSGTAEVHTRFSFKIKVNGWSGVVALLLKRGLT
jgi:hypothetical protein